MNTIIQLDAKTIILVLLMIAAGIVQTASMFYRHIRRLQTQVDLVQEKLTRCAEKTNYLLGISKHYPEIRSPKNTAKIKKEPTYVS